MDRRWLAVLAVTVVAVASGVWFGRGVTGAAPTRPAGLHTEGPAPASGTADVGTSAGTRPPAGTIVVHVSGWVETPGLVRLREGSRVGDAVAAAGGTRAGADLGALNLAAPLADGQQVVVPGPGAPAEAVGGPGAPADGVVHLNTATATDLETLPGVGPVLAERIVAHREQMGPFEAVEDLLEVSGIGEAKLASMRDLVAVP